MAEVTMPRLSDTMEEGTISSWLKHPGDQVRKGDVIAQIETDKATMDLTAFEAGTLQEILAPEGSTVAIGKPVARIGSGAASSAPAQAPPSSGKTPPTPAPAEAAPPAAAETGSQQPQTREARENVAEAPEPTASPSVPTTFERQAVSAPAADGKVRASPMARHMAAEHGLDLARINGSGPHGRVVARDVEGAKSGKGLKAPSAPAGAPSIAPSMSDKQILALFEPGSYEVVPHDGMRRTIAQRLTASVQTVPHFYLTMDCDIGKLLAAREEINAGAPKDKEKKPLYKLSVNDFVIKAMAIALQKIPNCNVSWTESGMLKHKHSDIGVAVAMPGGIIDGPLRLLDREQAEH